MSDRMELDELIGRLTRISRLSPQEATHLVDEVLAFLDEPLEEFVRRRHRELQREGSSNPKIFAQVAAEAGQRRFRVRGLSERQVRRMIYG